jgi:hypothetical protein
MCGIVGLFLKDESLQPELGRLLGEMLVVMTDRGPDSAGFAVYGQGVAGRIKLTLRGERLDEVVAALAGKAEATRRDTHLVLSIAAAHLSWGKVSLGKLVDGGENTVIVLSQQRINGPQLLVKMGHCDRHSISDFWRAMPWSADVTERTAKCALLQGFCLRKNAVWRAGC